LAGLTNGEEDYMKKLIAAGTATAVAVGAIGAFAATSQSATSVRLKDNVFVPKTLTVSRGSTVKFVWRGKAPHNVTVTKGPVKFKSKTMVKGSYSKKLTRRGTYTILCTIHAPGMRMTLKVK
jgi:plastocyanin